MTETIDYMIKFIAGGIAVVVLTVIVCWVGLAIEKTWSAWK